MPLFKTDAEIWRNDLKVSNIPLILLKGRGGGRRIFKIVEINVKLFFNMFIILNFTFLPKIEARMWQNVLNFSTSTNLILLEKDGIPKTTEICG